MDMGRTIVVGWICAALLAVLTGCGNYKFTFNVEDVINAHGGDDTRDRLPIDIVCITPEDWKQFEDVATGRVNAKEWFERRDTGRGVPPPARIFSLRFGGAEVNRGDTPKGEPLLSRRDLQNPSQVQQIQVRHPAYLDGKSRFVIYPRFRDAQGGVLPVAPLIIKPPGWLKDNELVIHVSRRSISWANEPS
jgi:hypothetical protein